MTLVAKSQNIAIVTIVSNNYLHFARTMLQSARQHHPYAALFCVVVDRDLSHAAEHAAEFDSISIDALNLPLGEEFFFQYNILELNTAVKPWAMAHLINQGYEQVFYVDPDIYFYGRMDDCFRALEAGTDILLTPHLLAPMVDDKLPRELDIRRAGAYNFGFCALRDSPNAREFLNWWKSKLTRDCVNDVDRGLFVDQGWIDLVPGLFKNVTILRHQGYNVAYWNIAQRQLEKSSANGYFIGEDPLVFFHFSGLDPSEPESFSKHQTRFTLSTVGPAKELVEEYVKVVLANGYGVFRKLEYGYGRFSNGEKIPDIFRNLYRQSGSLRKKMGAEPFTCFSAMCDLWQEICFDGISPTNAMVALWNVRHDVQAEFPLNSADSIIAYYRWFILFPPGAMHFPAVVISNHRAFVNRFDESVRKLPKSLGSKQERAWHGNEARVHRLYKHLLHRAPDQGGFVAYSEMCKTDTGFLRAWGEIGLSEESKNKRFLWLRMLAALLMSIREVDQASVEKEAPTAPARIKVVEQTLVGVFAVEADVANEGVWVSDRVVTPISTRPGDRIRLEGVYFPESIKKQTGSQESTLKFTLGSDEIHTAHISAHGNFIVECLVPPAQTARLMNLVLESSKFFVPRQIGQGDDERKLAWRMRLLSVANIAIFDCTNEDTFPAQASSTNVPDSSAYVSSKLAYSGFFQAEPDSEESGVWASANVVLPVVRIEGEKILLRGAYPANLIAKKTGDAESTLRFVVGGKLVHVATLRDDGDFTVEFALPQLSESDGDQLHIQSNNTFVPKDIGEGEDDRILSWRVKLLKAGKITVFDCTRQNIATSNRRFVPRMKHTPDFVESRVKLFAFYVPNFSQFERDGVWPPQKTASWDEISNALPQYADHHQPHLPVELGFYDYRGPGILKKQVNLARQYGIAGFCFQYYWSPDNRPIDQPLDRFLVDASLDFEFCAAWNNEEANALASGKFIPSASASDHNIALIDSLLPAFTDKRYRRIDQKPVLIVAHPASLNNVPNTVFCWRKRASQIGLPGVYLIACTFGELNNDRYTNDFDRVIEFPPSMGEDVAHGRLSKLQPTNPGFSGRIYDYDALATCRDSNINISSTSFGAVVPSWDNEVLAPGAGFSFADATPEKYANWLSALVAVTAEKRPEERLIFINAWNAWSEGAHMEPDQRHGYGYLHATATILLNLPLARNAKLIETINRSFAKRHETVVILHIFYEDLIDTIFHNYLSALQHQCDLIVSVMQNISIASLKKIKEKFANCFVIEAENRGRDIRPFLIAFRKAHELGYLYGCKLHTKKSLQRFDGDEWRTQLFDALLSNANSVDNNVQRFKNEPTTGIIASAQSIHDLAEPASYAGNNAWLDIFLNRMKDEKTTIRYDFRFPAGSMYWFRVAALVQLLDDSFVSLEEFELEAGQLDGTLSHAIERIVGRITTYNGFEISSVPTFSRKTVISR